MERTNPNLSLPSFALGAMMIAAVFAVIVALSGETTLAGETNEKAKAELAALQPKIKAGDYAVATFAGGCFWCVESNFDPVGGVVATVSGYMGGAAETGNYKTVSSGRTRHIEVLHVVFDPQVVSYPKLVTHFLRTTDVVDGGGQFCDRGRHYRPAIFAHTASQRKTAKRKLDALEASGRFDRPVAVELLDANLFVPAEDYHQNYHRTNPVRYKRYRYGCGRDRRVQALWGEDAVTH